MEMQLNATGPARLYAFLLRLRPLQQGTLMPFSGELVHGAFLKWLHVAAPDVAAWLHEGQKRRLFTCSSLHFAQHTQNLARAERENVHLPLDPQKTYTVRLTLLLGDLFPLFYEALMQFNATETKTKTAAPPFIQLGKQLFLLEEVILSNNDAQGWTGFTSLSTLVEKAAKTRFSKNAVLTLDFGSLTTFSRGSSKMAYGNHHVMLPLPQYVFQNLLRRWEDIATPDLVNMVQKEEIEQYLQEEGAVIIDYELRPHQVHFTTHVQRGFIGTCSYQLRGPDPQGSGESPLTVRQQLYVLAQMAFYSGIGYKTAMGLGQARLREGR